MAITNGYCTATQLREHFADATTKLDIALVERAIEAASRAIDEYCGRRFWKDSSTTVRTYRPSVSDEVYIDDIATVTGLVVKTDTTSDGTFDTTWTIDTDFQVEPLNADSDGSAYAWYRLAACDAELFPVTTGRRALLQVEATYGWSAVPKAVEEACLLKAASLYERKNAPFGVAGFDEQGVVRIGRSDPDVMELLAPRVRINLPER